MRRAELCEARKKVSKFFFGFFEKVEKKNGKNVEKFKALFQRALFFQAKYPQKKK